MAVLIVERHPSQVTLEALCRPNQYLKGGRLRCPPPRSFLDHPGPSWSLEHERHPRLKSPPGQYVKAAPATTTTRPGRAGRDGSSERARDRALGFAGRGAGVLARRLCLSLRALRGEPKDLDKDCLGGLTSWR